MPMVEIEKPADEPLGDWFEALRGWLDRNGCSSVPFARVGRSDGRLVYRLAFGDSVLAQKFSRTFAAYLTETSEAAGAKIPEFGAVETLGDAPA